MKDTPQNLSPIGSAIANRRIPSEFRPHLINIWNEIAEIMS